MTNLCQSLPWRLTVQQILQMAKQNGSKVQETRMQEKPEAEKKWKHRDQRELELITMAEDDSELRHFFQDYKNLALIKYSDTPF